MVSLDDDHIVNNDAVTRMNAVVTPRSHNQSGVGAHFELAARHGSSSTVRQLLDTHQCVVSSGFSVFVDVQTVALDTCCGRGLYV